MFHFVILCAIMWLFSFVLGEAFIPYVLSGSSWQWGHSMMMPNSVSHMVVEMNCTLYIVSGFRWLRSVGILWPILLELSLISLAPSWTLDGSGRDCWQGLVAICVEWCLAQLWCSGTAIVIDNKLWALQCCHSWCWHFVSYHLVYFIARNRCSIICRRRHSPQEESV